MPPFYQAFCWWQVGGDFCVGAGGCWVPPPPPCGYQGSWLENLALSGSVFWQQIPPLSVCFEPPPKRWSNTVGSPLGKQDPAQLDGVMGYQPQNSPLVLALGEGSRSWHQHSCWGVMGSRWGKLCSNTTWAACPAFCPFLPHPRPSSGAVQTLSRHGRVQAQPEHAARSPGV